mmetsp:Transcript_12207/g.42256  ORF Transcript_12207/g.42256 Transcript_12207/m.42256 type:complete len:273 (-) Transcript_12207:280-1098(-)
MRRSRSTVRFETAPMRATLASSGPRAIRVRSKGWSWASTTPPDASSRRSSSAHLRPRSSGETSSSSAPRSRKSPMSSCADRTRPAVVSATSTTPKPGTGAQSRRAEASVTTRTSCTSSLSKSEAPATTRLASDGEVRVQYATPRTAFTRPASSSSKGWMLQRPQVSLTRPCSVAATGMACLWRCGTASRLSTTRSIMADPPVQTRSTGSATCLIASADRARESPDVAPVSTSSRGFAKKGKRGRMPSRNQPTPRVDWETSWSTRPPTRNPGL